MREPIMPQPDFTAVYNQYKNLIYYYILRRMPDRELAADLTQNVFVKVYTQRHTHDPAKGELLAWIYRIARNEVIDYTRQVEYYTTEPVSRYGVHAEEIVGAYSFCVQPSPSLDAVWLRALVSRLPASQRGPVELVYLQGFSQKEAAEVLNVSIGAVKSGILRAKLRLRDYIERQVNPESIP